jgi:heavy metal efflux system protein
MLHSIIAFSIRNKLIIALMTLGLILYGILEVTRLPIDAVPDITDNQVQVITVAPSLGATDIERLITFPIEQANANIPGTKEIRSFSRFGLSIVTIVFKDETDIYLARQQVSERLSQIQNNLPKNIEAPFLGPVSTGLGEIYQYVVRPKEGYESKFSATELRTIQDWIVRRQLLGTEGVADVSSFGGNIKQWEVVIRPDELSAKNISIQQLTDAIDANNQNAGGSYIEKNGTALFIRTQGLINSKKDIESIRVNSSSDGIPVLVKDVANVREGTATRYGAMCYNDKGEVSGAVVMMLKGENSSKVIENIKLKIAEIQNTLPEGVMIEPFLDRTKMVNNAISTVEKNLLEGALIVLLVLILFLGHIRAGLLVASVIPLAMLFAVIMMNLFGVSGNLMSLGALDFGLIIDGAVIIVEAVLHQLHSKKLVSRLSNSERESFVEKSSSRMMNAAVFGQLIILIVYLPILSLEGVEGKMFKPMAQTVAFAILGAFILSLTYVPMMSAWLLKQPKNHKPNFSDRMSHWLEEKYGVLLSKAIHHKKKWVIGAVALLFVSFGIFSTLGGEFIPELEEGDFAVDTRVLTGSNLQTTINSTQQATALLLKEFPEVEKIVTKIGSGEIPTDPMPIEASDMMVILKDKSEWQNAESFDELAEKMGERLKTIPGITTGFQYPVQMRFNELMTGARQDVVCKIYGEDLDTLAHYAERFGNVVETIDGATDLYIEPVSGMPQIVIAYNRASIAQHQLSIEEINNVVETGFAGRVSGQLYEGEKKFDIAIKLDTNKRKNLIDVQNLLVQTPLGSKVPLRELASVEIVNGPNQIQRDNTRRRIVIGFNVRGRDVETIVNELQQKLKSEIDLPAGYSVTYGGAFENLQKATNRLMIAVPIALLLILILLYFAFRSIKESLLIYSAIPLSAIGGIIALWLRDMPFSISAGVGFIALFGVAVLNGIVLLSEIKRLNKTEEKTPLESVLLATKTRLRPVLMTAAVASLGFMPMALSNGAGAEVQRPLATVVIGGLITATVLTLFVLPILYLLTQSKMKIKPSATIVASALLLLLGFSNASIGQTIDLETLQKQALENNLMIKSKKIQVEQMKALSTINAELEPIQINGEYGQINSAAQDHRLTINQSIPSVGYLKASKKERELQLSKMENQLQLEINNVRRTVASSYYKWMLLEKLSLLHSSNLEDMKLMEQKSKLRVSQGESARWELELIQEELWKTEKSLNELKAQVFEQTSQLLLLTGNTALDNSRPNWELPALPDSLNMDRLSQFQFLKQVEIEKSLAETERRKLEKSRLPSYTIGAAAMTIQGYQNTTGLDEYYGKSDYFFTAQAGISIPLFSANGKKIQAKNLEISSLENLTQLRKQEITQVYTSAYQSAQLQLKTIEAFQSRIENTMNQANQRFDLLKSQGEIDTLQWLQLKRIQRENATEYLNSCDQYLQAITFLYSFETQK